VNPSSFARVFDTIRLLRAQRALAPGADGRHAPSNRSLAHADEEAPASDTDTFACVN
jgi:hypothetical protein